MEDKFREKRDIDKLRKIVPRKFIRVQHFGCVIKGIHSAVGEIRDEYFYEWSPFKNHFSHSDDGVFLFSFLLCPIPLPAPLHSDSGNHFFSYHFLSNDELCSPKPIHNYFAADFCVRELWLWFRIAFQPVIAHNHLSERGNHWFCVANIHLSLFAFGDFNATTACRPLIPLAIFSLFFHYFFVIALSPVRSWLMLIRAPPLQIHLPTKLTISNDF